MSTLEAQGRKNSALYGNLQAKDQQLQTLQTLQTSSTVVVRPAGFGAQISPHPKRDAALGLILGIMLGFGFAFGLEALDTRIRSTSRARRGSRRPASPRPHPAAHERAMQKRNELAMVVQPKHNAAEAFRLLRTNLEFVRLSAGDVRTILVTSGLEKEGKSTTAANLAVAEARAGRRVALVDLDLRRPYVDRFFRLTAAEGITDVALGRVELEQALQRIDLNLGAPDAGAVLPVATARARGRRSPRPACSTCSSPGRCPRIRASSRRRTGWPRSWLSSAKHVRHGDRRHPAASVGRRCADALLAGGRDDRDRTDEGATASDAPRAAADSRARPGPEARLRGNRARSRASSGVYGHKDGYSYGYGYGYGSSDRTGRGAAGAEKLGSVDGTRASTGTASSRGAGQVKASR